MIRREVSSMRPSLAALFLAGCICVPFRELGAEAARRPARKIPKFEITLSGPTSLSAQYSLESQRFTARLTNRSAEPQVLFVRDGYLMNTRWDWTVTDAKGAYVGMEFVPHLYCGTIGHVSEEEEAEARRIRDKDLVVLALGESREFPIPAGPSDDYNFPAAGTYHLAITLTYVPPNATYYFDRHGKRQKAEGYEQWDLSQLSVDTLQAVQNSLSIQATSDNWNLVLPTARVHPNADFIPNILVVPAER